MNKSILESIFKPINNDVIKNPNSKISSNSFITKGSLITFNYLFWKNDPYPLVIVNESIPSKKLWGINLHYLTFNYMKKIINNCKNPMFSYQRSIKNDNYLKNSYRSYNWEGIRQIKTLNCDFLLNIIASIRSQDPAEVEIIRKNVREQINKQINPKSYEINIESKTLNNKETPSQKTISNVKTVPLVGENLDTE